MSADRGLAQLAQLLIALVALAATVAGVWIGYQQLVESRRTPGDRVTGSDGPRDSGAPDSTTRAPTPYRPPVVDASPPDVPVHARFKLFDGQVGKAAGGRVSVRAFTTAIGAAKEWELRMLVGDEVLKCAVTQAPQDCGTLKAVDSAYRLSIEQISPDSGSLEVVVDEVR